MILPCFNLQREIGKESFALKNTKCKLSAYKNLVLVSTSTETVTVSRSQKLSSTWLKGTTNLERTLVVLNNEAKLCSLWIFSGFRNMDAPFDLLFFFHSFWSFRQNFHWCKKLSADSATWTLPLIFFFSFILFDRSDKIFIGARKIYHFDTIRYSRIKRNASHSILRATRARNQTRIWSFKLIWLQFLNAREKNGSRNELEMFSKLRSWEHFENYLLENHFEVLP